jgi:hypothetical protein
MELNIDPEFEALCPKLSTEEQQYLHNDIISRGVISPIVIWARGGQNVILDGHNRYRICKEFDREFATHELWMKTREEAMNWMILHQLGRRNLSPDAARILRAKLHNSRKKDQNDGGKGTAKATDYQIDSRLPTAEIVAKETGVSPATIYRDAKFAAAVEAAGKTAAVMAGEKFKKPKEAPSPKPPKPPKPVLTLEEEFEKKFIRFMDQFAVTDHEKVMEMIKLKVS